MAFQPNNASKAGFDRFEGVQIGQPNYKLAHPSVVLQSNFSFPFPE